ncbi:MAG: hypothetical protein QJR09_03830 [Micrococcus sp.]|nr:hypothetical protein [Micrococcus sp.]
MAEEPGVAAPHPAPGALEVTVLRSGGVAGMVRRWSAAIPDDGTPAARAARRIAGLGPATVDRRPRSGPSRDAFQWTITCGEGSLRCDDAGRREDAGLDELLRRVTGSG